MAGRTPQPAALQLLHGRGNGTDSGGRKVAQAPLFRRIAPKPPSWLSREAAAEWRRVVPGLQRLDLLKEEDRATLSAYCETWATFVTATRTVAKEGQLYKAAQGLIPHPAVAIARNAGRELRAYANHFGLSPAAETALRRTDGDGAEEANPFSG